MKVLSVLIFFLYLYWKPVVRKGDWRQKHTELIKAIRQARDVTVAIKAGGPLPTFQPSAIPSGKIRMSFFLYKCKRVIIQKI